MKQQPYTPGPWTVDIHGCILGGDGLESVAETYQAEWENCPDSPLRIAGIERAIANGKLIIAAPQLLAELERLVDLITDPDGAYVTLEDCDVPKELIAAVYEGKPSIQAPLTELASLKAALKLIASKEVNHPLREHIEEALNSCKEIARDAITKAERGGGCET